MDQDTLMEKRQMIEDLMKEEFAMSDEQHIQLMRERLDAMPRWERDIWLSSQLLRDLLGKQRSKLM